MSGGPTPNDFRAKVFEDRGVPANWRVEKMDEAGGYEVVKVFTGPDARGIESSESAHLASSCVGRYKASSASAGQTSAASLARLYRFPDDAKDLC
jgi:hypothetical protein